MVADILPTTEVPSQESEKSSCKAGISRELLGGSAEYFQKLSAEEQGGDVNAELAQLALGLAPKAREVLPIVVERLGAFALEAEKPAYGEERWESLFQRCGVLHIFAVAHLLGASELLNAARNWVAAKEGRLEVAISDLDVEVDAGSLRIALDFGLDQRCGKRSFIHAVAAVDAAPAMRIVLERRGDVLLDPETLVDLRDSCGRTPLHTCAIHDSTETASVLIEASANLEALCSCEGDDETSEDEAMDQRTAAASDALSLPLLSSQARKWTPLHSAASHDSANVAQILLDARANVAACLQGVPGAHTPLHEAAEANAGNVARILALAAVSAMVDGSIFLKCENDSNDIAKEHQQSENGDDANKTNSEEQDVPRWSRFLDPLNAKCGRHGSTPLHVAAEHDASCVIRALMETKADPCLTDDQGDTPLHCAVLYGAPGALSELLAHSAPLMLENGSGELPLHVLAEFGLGEESDEDPAAVLSDIAMRRHFAKSDRTRELLISALREKGQLETALVHKAAGLDGGTPLHSVALKNHLGATHAVRVLAEARADLESRDNGGRTPFMLARRRYGDVGRVVVELRKLGAKEDTESITDSNLEKHDCLKRAISASSASDGEDPFAKALGGCVRRIQVGGLNIMECVIPKDVEAEGPKAEIKEEPQDVKEELKVEVKEELKEEVKDEFKDEQSAVMVPKSEEQDV